MDFTPQALTPLDQNSSAAVYYAYEKKRNAIWDAAPVQNLEMIGGEAGLSQNLALADLKEAYSPFSALFFSDANFEDIQNRIRWGVYQQTKKVIPPQKGSSLSIIAQRLYEAFVVVPDSVGAYKAEIDRINTLVRDQCVHIITSEMDSYARYKRDVNERVFLQTSENTTMTGTKGIGFDDPRNPFTNM